ncbi:divalent-cation tolerance protein CutA [Mariniblastus fucicola]|uniref:Divalent-cation tolerance protein CutA n=1 Tax=Mariniblastus fucicola TaxID=980251 RepID=A0A5B9PBV4_9BACT|nr:divalent-cation tolerance protein CutA [Mariniblastus fucicola]QEG24207.1 Divalent-cation tolerance protein CutA [Mariniblastus fucicola]
MERNLPVIVSTTADAEDLLERIANALLENRLAACCQISGPIKSVYRWDGKVESSSEHACSIKTVSDHVDTVIKTIGELHSYDEPEIVVTPIIGGSDSYLKWIFDSVQPVE